MFILILAAMIFSFKAFEICVDLYVHGHCYCIKASVKQRYVVSCFTGRHPDLMDCGICSQANSKHCLSCECVTALYGVALT